MTSGKKETRIARWSGKTIAVRMLALAAVLVLAACDTSVVDVPAARPVETPTRSVIAADDQDDPQTDKGAAAIARKPGEYIMAVQ